MSPGGKDILRINVLVFENIIYMYMYMYDIAPPVSTTSNNLAARRPRTARCALALIASATHMLWLHPDRPRGIAAVRPL